MAALSEPAAHDARDGDPRLYDYSSPERECDVVMKGGITSGVVYPHAICELARAYRLVSIGGTSAGAIAAVGAAAAEYGRDDGGFAKLAAVPDWVATGSNLKISFNRSRKRRASSACSSARGAETARARSAWRPQLRARIQSLRSPVRCRERRSCSWPWSVAGRRCCASRLQSRRSFYSRSAWSPPFSSRSRSAHPPR